MYPPIIAFCCLCLRNTHFERYPLRPALNCVHMVMTFYIGVELHHNLQNQLPPAAAQAHLANDCSSSEGLSQSQLKPEMKSPAARATLRGAPVVARKGTHTPLTVHRFKILAGPLQGCLQGLTPPEKQLVYGRSGSGIHPTQVTTAKDSRSCLEPSTVFAPGFAVPGAGCTPRPHGHSKASIAAGKQGHKGDDL